jgi:hypothetical protein
MTDAPDVGRWCFETYRGVFANLPRDLAEEDTLRDDLCLFKDEKVSLFYSPFDQVNEQALVVLMGITPGRYQHWMACCAARDALAEGLADEEVLHRAKRVGSFSGPMRRNLVMMLDGIGLNQALGIATCALLFEEGGASLLFSTSAVSFPVFVRRKNYTGSTPRLLKHDLLRLVVDRVLVARLERVKRALVIPLGSVATEVAEHLVKEHRLNPERFLQGFPHPSGGNGYRVRRYNENRDRMALAVEAWFERRPAAG